MLQKIIWAIAILGAIGVLLILLPVFGVAIPGYIVQIFWVVVAVCVGIMAVKFIAQQASTP